MKNLTKVVQIAHAGKKNWHHELTKFLRAYRATPHSMTGVPPAALMFNGCRYATNLPGISPKEKSKLQLQSETRDREKKQKMKQNADKKATIKWSNLTVGERVLVKQRKLNKLTTPYEGEPYTVDEVRGSQITASNRIHQVTGHVNMFKRIPREGS